jgi:hypothetical protein
VCRYSAASLSPWPLFCRSWWSLESSGTLVPAPDLLFLFFVIWVKLCKSEIKQVHSPNRQWQKKPRFCLCFWATEIKYIRFDLLRLSSKHRGCWWVHWWLLITLGAQFKFLPTEQIWIFTIFIITSGQTVLEQIPPFHRISWSHPRISTLPQA